MVTVNVPVKSGTEATIVVNVVAAVCVGVGVPLSVTVTVIEADPFRFAAGVMAIKQFGAVPENVTLALGIRVVFVDIALKLPLQFSVESTSAIVTAIFEIAVSSSVDLFVTVEIVGASLIAFTVKTKTEEAVCAGKGDPLSVRVNVTVVDPFEFDVGVRVAVQLGAVPAITIFALGTSVVLLELAVTLLQNTVESKSTIVNAIALVVLSSLTEVLLIEDICGA